jgi:short-subunit dehydrogenase involved in D-alanine esterification of teichoic acids
MGTMTFDYTVSDVRDLIEADMIRRMAKKVKGKTPKVKVIINLPGYSEANERGVKPGHAAVVVSF